MVSIQAHSYHWNTVRSKFIRYLYVTVKRRVTCCYVVMRKRRHTITGASPIALADGSR
jgi:hypothetical protein